MTRSIGRLTNEDLALRIIIRARAHTMLNQRPHTDPQSTPPSNSNEHSFSMRTTKHTQALDTRESIRLALSGGRRAQRGRNPAATLADRLLRRGVRLHCCHAIASGPVPKS